jgi:Thioredoxin like C-terminal domain
LTFEPDHDKRREPPAEQRAGQPTMPTIEASSPEDQSQDFKISPLLRESPGLVEAGTTDHDHDLVSVEAAGVEAPADWATLRSSENYTGYARAGNFASPGGIRPGQPHHYTAPAQLKLNHWALAGDWTVEAQAARLGTAGGQIICRFHARDLNLVMGPAAPDTPVSFQVLLDGQQPGPDHGSDIDDHGSGTLSVQRLYQLIRQRGPVSESTFQIIFPDPGAEAYSFTFG